MRLSVLFLSMAIIASCGAEGGDRPEAPAPTEPPGGAVATLATIVHMTGIGGAPFGAIADDGTAFLPVNLPREYAQDGARVFFTGALTNDIGPWGKTIEIDTIEVVDSPSPGAQLVASGTVVFVDLEGGFYGIVEDAGGRYDPINLPRSLKVDGLRVSFDALVRNDVATFHMWGVSIQLQRTQPL